MKVERTDEGRWLVTVVSQCFETEAAAHDFAEVMDRDHDDLRGAALAEQAEVVADLIRDRLYDEDVDVNGVK